MAARIQDTIQLGDAAMIDPEAILHRLLGFAWISLLYAEFDGSLI